VVVEKGHLADIPADEPHLVVLPVHPDPVPDGALTVGSNQAFEPSRVDVVSMYVDQFPINDMAREQADEFGAKIYPTVAEALRCGGKRLAVDGVAVIGEHGKYPRTARGNYRYPRYRYFQEISRVFEEDGGVIPYFNDKYFAYEWEDAQRMFDRIRSMKIPFMCGSTLPLTWRRPSLEYAAGVELEELLAVSFSDLEEHAYHAIELLQTMAERREGGETGIAAIRCVTGDEVWNLGRRGEWSQNLLDAALSRRVNPVHNCLRFPKSRSMGPSRDAGAVVGRLYGR
jgi:hypothetical protein